MSSNFVLGWRNLVFTTPGTFDLDVGTVTAGALTDLADLRLSKRVTMTGETAGAFGNSSLVLHWYVAEADASALQLVGLLNYAISAPGASSVVVQLSVLGVSGTGDVEEQTLTLWERPSADFPQHAWHLLDAPLADGYWVTVFVTATMGASGGAVSMVAGGLWAGPIWTMPQGMDGVWAGEVVDPGKMPTSEGRQGYPGRRQKYRAFGGRAVHVPINWAYGDPDDPLLLDIQQLQMRVGTTEPVALFPRTRNAAGSISTHLMHRLGMYSHFSQLGKTEHMGGDLFQWTDVRWEELM